MIIDVSGKKMKTRVLLTEKEIKERTQTLATKINADYGREETLVVLVVLHGALLFAADLVRFLDMPTEIESTRIKSYHGTESSGKIEMLSQLPNDLEGKHVLVVEDIVDTGRSLAFLLPKLKEAGVKSVKVAALLDKQDCHPPELSPQYVGFSIGKNFVIGFGLDLDGKYRNLPYVAELVNV